MARPHAVGNAHELAAPVAMAAPERPNRAPQAPLAVPIGERLALRIEEAAELVGLSERSFRDHLLADPGCPRIYIGKSVRIPRRLFAEYLESRARADDGNSV